MAWGLEDVGDLRLSWDSQVCLVDKSRCVEWLAGNGDWWLSKGTPPVEGALELSLARRLCRG